MRSDAANLLSRLGQNNFKYQEFRDNFADMELWPLFEALIRDPRISGEAGAGPAQAATAPAQAVRAAVEAAPVAGGLFGRYDPAPVAPPAAAPRKTDDVRSMLRQLGDRVAAGEL